MSKVKYIPAYWMCPAQIREEANRIICNLYQLVGTGISEWSLSIGGVKGQKRAKAREIIHRAKMLEDLVKERTSS